MIVHHHSIIVAKVELKPEQITETDLYAFLDDFVEEIEMQKIFDPIIINGKFGFTGVVGIVTSHIAFHYFDEDQSLHLDVYSCKEYDLSKVVNFVNNFWKMISADIAFIKRDTLFDQKKYQFENGVLIENQNVA